MAEIRERVTNMVTSIKKNKSSSLDWTVVETLRTLANEIESGEVDYNKCIVLLLKNDKEGEYSSGFRLSNMVGSEAVALIEIQKNDLINAILGLPSTWS